MDDGLGVFLTLSLFIIAGVVILVAAMNNRRRLLEIAHRERLAWIERGLIPAPEIDPAGFEAAAKLKGSATTAARADRHRTAGVVMIGLGLALMLLIGFAAGAPSIGIGVGGAWVMLGAAFVVNHFLMVRRDYDPYVNSSRWAQSSRERHDPPSNSTT